MPNMDTAGKNALASRQFAVAWYIWIDIVDDPIRFTSFGADQTFSGTGDADLDGKTFLSMGWRVLEMGEVSNSDGGSDTLSISLGNISSIDEDLMADIADTTKWRGRTVRLWFRLYDETGVTAQGAMVPYYTGYASALKVMPSPKVQEIRLGSENYLAAFNHASNRGYGNQKDYDPTDNSFEATLAAANMGRGSPGPGGPGSGTSNINLGAWAKQLGQSL